MSTTIPKIYRSMKLRPSPLSLAVDTTPNGLSRQDPPTPPPNPPPTPRRRSSKSLEEPLAPRARNFSFAVGHDGWSLEETGNLVLACRSGVELVALSLLRLTSKLCTDLYQEWDEVAALFPGKSQADCCQKYLQLQQLEVAAEKYIEAHERCVY